MWILDSISWVQYSTCCTVLPAHHYLTTTTTTTYCMLSLLHGSWIPLLLWGHGSRILLSWHDGHAVLTTISPLLLRLGKQMQQEGLEGSRQAPSDLSGSATRTRAAATATYLCCYCHMVTWHTHWAAAQQLLLTWQCNTATQQVLLTTTNTTTLWQVT